MKLMKRLKFSYGYVDGLRRVVNVMTGKLTGSKSHDYNISWKGSCLLYFEAILMMLWKVLVELRYFCR
jgi:hypothetical protein